MCPLPNDPAGDTVQSAGEPEPAFRYALNEVLFQFLTHNGDVPLLAACDHFVVGRAREQRSFDIAFEVEVVSPSGDKSEHDIVATWGSELWLGEATTTDTLGSNIGQESEPAKTPQGRGRRPP